MAKEHEEELPDFDEDENEEKDKKAREARDSAAASAAVMASGFKDFLLRPELMKAIVECGFEHPSEVQHACIPQAVLGTDILCQAKSGMGKTAVFVLACLQTLQLTEEKAVKVLVLCHTRELAYQIEHEFLRLGKHLTGLKVAAVYGGVPLKKDKDALTASLPHILVGTPGRILQLLQGGESAALKLDKLSHFILDECDRCIDTLDMRRDVQKVFFQTAKKKQVMMFSATMSTETRGICKKFMQEPHEITVESEAKLTLHGLLQYYQKVTEKTKIKSLIDLLDALEFNQVVIFVKSVKRALALDGVLNENKFPSMTLHEIPKGFEHKVKAGEFPSAKDTRIDRFKLFKDFRKRILVATDLFGRGMDVERVNIVINFDMPADSDAYLHRVGRAGRFGTKGLAISFVGDDEDQKVMSSVQSRFDVNIEQAPAHIDSTSYLNA
eukprot:TRINITY_DN1730_c0_g1_i1.p1 TRINITY_DN1730_c0_g1~~TRINITY_DN1730_c0_g1_i1.p1  ORF type:complete len:440 (+),score=142.91 TRINITY_DN1730_c0_g1_i1:123-1442(+)